MSSTVDNPPFSVLYGDILHIIFVYLGFNDLLRLRATSHSLLNEVREFPYSVQKENNVLKSSADIVEAKKLGENWLWCGKGIECVNYMSVFHSIDLSDCTGLTSVDGLATAPVLKELDLTDCTGLTSVDALATSSSLKELVLFI
jgi:Leucine-rich repeat (LRR) protein